MFLCCWKKSSGRKNRSSTRSHQRLVPQDSGTVAIPVQRVAGPPTVRHLAEGNNNDSPKASTPDVSGTIKYSPLYRNQPNRSLQNESRLHADNPRISALQAAISRFSFRKEEENDEQTTRKPSVISANPRSRQPGSLADCFTLSSSFEGLDQADLQFDIHDSKLSSYDNLYTPSDAESDVTNRKQSLYDNVDDGDAQPLVETADRKLAAETSSRDQRFTPVAPRRASRTLPLRFTLFTGGQQAVQNSDYQDYVNLTPSSPDQRSVESRQASESVDKPVAPERKKKGRRGSKALKLFCPRRQPILNKIEKQVLAYVPIYGEPSPGSAGASRPLKAFEFPPPPPSSSPLPAPSPGCTAQTPLPGGAFISCSNPMYCPNTAGTPGYGIDTDDPFNRPNVYFSF